MPLQYLADAGYSGGMVRDVASFAIPSGSVYDAANMVTDTPGVMRQRGPTTALVSGAQTAFATSIGFCYSQDATPIEELYGYNGKTGAVSVINKSTGAATSLGTPGSGVIGRPVRHFGFLVFPIMATPRQAVAVAGQVNSTGFASTSNVTMTAGAQQITLAGADTTTNIKVGAIVFATDSSTTDYFGRVVSIDSSTKFTVWPTPPAPLIGSIATTSTYDIPGGACTTSFQNRLLLGNTNDLSSTGATLLADRRVYYSLLPTESVAGHTGATFLSNGAYPALNYFQIPSADPIIAMEPISDGELVILTSTSVVIFQGNLVTELADTSPSITYDIYPLGVTEGCASDMSVQRTPVGIMWAGVEGVFAYWPPLRKSPAKTGVRNLCEGKILKYWQTLSAASDFAVHGGAYARDHYFVSGFASGAPFSLAVNLNTNAWTRLTGAGTDMFNGVRRPSKSAQTFSLRWWDQTGAAPSLTNGQTVRLETMLDPDAAGQTKLDADGSAVLFSVTTRPIGGDFETQKMFQRGTFRYQCESDTVAVAVGGQTRVDSNDTNSGASRTFTGLGNTAARTVTGATNATPIEITTSAAHGLGTGSYVNIDAVGGNTNANGRFRITRTAATTFTIDGSSGNAAYTSGGTVQKITETDSLMSTLNKGQAASFTISASGAAVNRFELHGITIAALVSQPVMST